MRWVFIILGLIGLMTLMKSFGAKLWAQTYYVIPGTNLGLTWGFTLIVLFLLVGAAKLGK